MGNEHFWQVPRAKGVYARSITKHARARKLARRGATSGRPHTAESRLRASPKSAI